MTLPEYRDTPTWQGAIALGPLLMRLAEELPASEEHGLSRQLRKLTVELPATLAADAIRGAGEVRLMPILKLLAALELIDKVYPALDTAAARSAAESLAGQMPAAAPPVLSAVPSAGSLAAAPADLAAAPVEPAALRPEPPTRPETPAPPAHPGAAAHVPVVPEPEDEPEPAGAGDAQPASDSVSVTVQHEAQEETAEDDVHPDSV